MTGWLVAATLVIAGGIVALELWLRRSGVLDVPLFRFDDDGTYRAAPNQSGSFMGRHEWRYDRRGMRFSGEAVNLAGATILVGDSVVDGGNRIGQPQTLPALLAAELDETVYPVAARGWALANELAALTAMPRWEQAKRLILVINSGDFATHGSMPDRFIFPRRRPLLALPWLVARQVRRKLVRSPSDPHRPELHAQTIADFGAIATQFGGPVTIVRYPMKGEHPAADPRFAELHAAAPGSTLLDLGAAPKWGDDCYSDHIHPSAKGLMVLARFIGQNAA